MRLCRFCRSYALRAGTLRSRSKGSQGYAHYRDSNNDPLFFHTYSFEGCDSPQPSVGHVPTDY